MPTKVKGTTGVDKVEAGAVITNPEFSGNATVTGTLTVNSTASINGSNISTQPSFRNRIINGNMAIDQRNNGSSATANSNAYFVDRLQLQASGSPPVLTGERVTDAPNDFKYSMKFTTNATTDTLTASEAVTPRQNIEGFNVADFNFGNANAKEFTVSFWVKGSVTGTYGFCVMNAGFNRHYVTTYNINSANTWEKKTITLTADTSGTWDATTGVGVRIMFPIDTGPDMETTTTETWGTGDYRRTSSCVKLLQTSSATWQITGLQVELGSTATPFENRMYGTELALCQRYYYKTKTTSASDRYAFFYPARVTSATQATVCATYPTMRTSPSITQANTGINIGPQGSTTAFSGGWVTPSSAWIDVTVSGVSMTTGQCVMLNANNSASAYVAMDAEL